MSIDDDDYDHCGIAQDETRFSSNTKSPCCPKVGVCGHSFCAKSLKEWDKVRKAGQYHSNNSSWMECPYHCSEPKFDDNSQTTVMKDIKAFHPQKLVTNHNLCQAIQAIERFKEGKKTTAKFGHCPNCKKLFSTKANHSQSPRVGLCGHTVCLECLQDLAKNKGTKTLSCPKCKRGKAFCTDRLAENFDLVKALRHWEGLKQAEQKKKEEEKAKAEPETADKSKKMLQAGKAGKAKAKVLSAAKAKASSTLSKAKAKTPAQTAMATKKKKTDTKKKYVIASTQKSTRKRSAVTSTNVGKKEPAGARPTKRARKVYNRRFW